jgi:hypothetical protein
MYSLHVGRTEDNFIESTVWKFGIITVKMYKENCLLCSGEGGVKHRGPVSLKIKTKSETAFLKMES